MVYGLTALNRIVCANRLFGGLGFRSLGRLKAPTLTPPTFFVRWNCFAIPLSRTKKRRIQPKRYTPLVLSMI